MNKHELANFNARDPLKGVSETLYKRWSPRSFQKTKIDSQVLNRIFDAARFSPSCFNEQPWRFYTSTDETFSEYLDLLVPANQVWAKNASIIGFLVGQKNFARNGNPNNVFSFDCGSAWMSMTEQQIDIQMADGRVHHRGLEMNVHDVVIRTQGWVGLDQSLSMLAEVPIRDQWVQRDRFLSALRGQSIRIPITGTLSHPKVDRSALRQLSRQLLGGAAERLLQDELQRQLKNLFRP